MKESTPFNVTDLLESELTTIDGGSVDPDALREYMEERYDNVTAYDFRR